MAKISSYPSDANVTTSDRLIGSDNENSNETKNFSVGDIINLAASIIIPAGGYVPYTGATGNVDLGTYNLIADNVQANIFQLNSGGILGIYGEVQLNGSPGTAGYVLTSNGGGTPSWTSLAGYVPYTGATGNVNLGTYDLTADNHYGNIFQVNSLLALYGGLQLNGSYGTAGHVLTSSGGSSTPTWTSLAGYVPYTGAHSNVDLGAHSLTATSVFANNFGPIASGNVFFGGAGGYNNTQNGVYCIGANLTLLGNSSSSGNGTKIEIYDPNKLILIGKSTESNIEIDGAGQYISVNNAEFAIGGVQGLQLFNGNGTAGESVLVSGGGNAPSWAYPQDIVAFPFLSAYSDLTQSIVTANVGQPMIIHQTVVSSAISIFPNGSGDLTRITFNDSGVYNIQFSAQLRRTTGGTSQTIDIWFRKGGSDIPYSNTSVNVQANAGYLVASWNFFYNMDVTQPNPYIEIMWAATDNSVTIEAAAANAVHPATPSVIVTVNKVSNV